MSESEELSALISLIYDAALDSTQWTKALEAVTGFLKCAYATLGSFDAVQINVAFNFVWGDNADYTALYIERYAQRNPMIPASASTPVGGIVSIIDYMTYEEMQETEVYREWAKPQGYVDIAQATLEKSGTALAVLAVVRHESVGRVDDEMRRRLALLVPHMRRAILIGKVIDLKTVQAQAFEETIDGLAAGVFLLDARGKVAHANAAAHALLAEGDAARLAGGGLAVFDPDAERLLREAIAAAGEAGSTAGAGGITLFGRSGVGYVAHVLPLASGARRAAGAPHAATVAVFLRRAIVDLAQAVGSLARHHGLTPAETRVLLAVAEQGGVSQIAAGLGMSEATVKTHLQRIFKKTGTSRQVDLVKLAFGFAGPLAA